MSTEELSKYSMEPLTDVEEAEEDFYHASIEKRDGSHLERKKNFIGIFFRWKNIVQKKEYRQTEREIFNVFVLDHRVSSNQKKNSAWMIFFFWSNVLEKMKTRMKMNDDDVSSDDVSLSDYDHDWISSFYSSSISNAHPRFS